MASINSSTAANDPGDRGHPGSASGSGRVFRSKDFLPPYRQRLDSAQALLDFYTERVIPRDRALAELREVAVEAILCLESIGFWRSAELLRARLHAVPYAA
jgi:hypothetical protein